MKKGILSLITSLVVCVGLCFGLAACGEGGSNAPNETTVTQETYTGEIEVSETKVIPVELVLDDFGTFTLVSTNGEGLPIGFLGLPKNGVGGIYHRSGNVIIFETLVGEEIATATTTENSIAVNYDGWFEFELSKSVKTVQKDALYGSYKGYVDDGRAFELRLILRGNQNWLIVEEDGDVNDFGKYILEGALITAYYNDEPDKICAFGTVNGTLILMNVEGDDVSFQKI